MNEQRFSESGGGQIYSSGPLSSNPHERVIWQDAPPFSEASTGQYTLPYGPDTQPRHRVRSQATTDRLPRPRPRRWLSLLIFLLLLAFVAGTVLVGLRAASIGVRAVMLSARDFSVGARTTLNIRDDVGSVNVHTGKSGLITVRATVDKDIFGAQPTVSYNQQGNTFNIDTTDSPWSWLGRSAVALDVTVPVSMDVAISVDIADITINDIQGKLVVKDNTGNVSINDTTLRGTGTIQTTTGNISINSTFANGANYDAKTNTGHIDITLPAKAHTSIAASSNTGDITSSVQSVQVSSSGSGQQASGNVGGAKPPSSLTLESDTGSIAIKGN